MGNGEITSVGKPLGAALFAFSVVVVLAGIDLLADFGEGTTLGHVLTEGGVIVSGLFGVALIARQLLRANASPRGQPAG